MNEDCRTGWTTARKTIKGFLLLLPIIVVSGHCHSIYAEQSQSAVKEKEKSDELTRKAVLFMGALFRRDWQRASQFVNEQFQSSLRIDDKLAKLNRFSSQYGNFLGIEKISPGKVPHEIDKDLLVLQCRFAGGQFDVQLIFDPTGKISDLFYKQTLQNDSSLETLAKQLIMALAENQIDEIAALLKQNNSRLSQENVIAEWRYNISLLGPLETSKFTPYATGFYENESLVIINCPFKSDTIPILIRFNGNNQMISFQIFKPNWVKAMEEQIEAKRAEEMRLRQERLEQQRRSEEQERRAQALKKDLEYYRQSLNQVAENIRSELSRLQPVKLPAYTSPKRLGRVTQFTSYSLVENFYLAESFYKIVDSGRERLFDKYREDKYAGLRAYIFKFYPARALFPSVKHKNYPRLLIEESTVKQYESIFFKFVSTLLNLAPSNNVNKACITYETYSEPVKGVFVRLIPAYDIPGYPKSKDYQPNATYTDNRIENVWLGYYVCVATKNGYKEARSDFDLAKNPGTKIICSLVPDGEQGDSQCILEGDKK